MYQSNAIWTNIGKSKDIHATEQETHSICKLLMKLYGPKTKGCPNRGICIGTWIEITDKEIKDKSYFSAYLHQVNPLNSQ